VVRPSLRKAALLAPPSEVGVFPAPDLLAPSPIFRPAPGIARLKREDKPRQQGMVPLPGRSQSGFSVTLTLHFPSSFLPLFDSVPPHDFLQGPADPLPQGTNDVDFHLLSASNNSLSLSFDPLFSSCFFFFR